jgi:hypothetical protein
LLATPLHLSIYLNSKKSKENFLRLEKNIEPRYRGAGKQRLDSSSSSKKKNLYSTAHERALESPELLIQQVPVVKGLRREANHSPPSSAKMKRWRYYPIRLYGMMLK